MSKIRIGNQVRIKATGGLGIVMGREERKLPDNKISVEYVVKTGDGFENYNVFLRHQIEKVKPVEEEKKNVSTVYPKVYNYEYKCADGRTLVVTGVVDTYYDNVGESEAYGSSRLIEVMKVKRKALLVGYAICHPDDNNDKEIGAKIALRRAYKKPISVMYSPFTGEFREDLVTIILYAKAKFIEENINRFIERDKDYFLTVS